MRYLNRYGLRHPTFLSQPYTIPLAMTLKPYRLVSHATSPRPRGCVSLSARSFSLSFVPRRQFFHGLVVTGCPEALGEAHATQQRNNPKKAHHIPLVYGRTKHGINLESLLRMRVFSMLRRVLGFNRHTTPKRTRVTLIFMIYS